MRGSHHLKAILCLIIFYLFFIFIKKNRIESQNFRVVLMFMGADILGCVPFGACTIWRVYHLTRVPFGACTIWHYIKNKLYFKMVSFIDCLVD
jgi:hypothetical protein